MYCNIQNHSSWKALNFYRIKKKISILLSAFCLSRSLKNIMKLTTVNNSGKKLSFIYLKYKNSGKYKLHIHSLYRKPGVYESRSDLTDLDKRVLLYSVN